MSADDLVLSLQRVVDRLVRRLRLGPAPPPGRRRLLVVQIDGLAREVLELALAQGYMPFLARLLGRGWRLTPMSVGLPTSTPAFQLSVMYGVRPDIPGFHYHDRRRGRDVYFPRRGDAAAVEAAQAAGRPGILEGGSAYGCVFTGGAVNNVFSFAMIKRPTGAGLLRLVSAFVVLGWVVVKGGVITGHELLRAVLRFVADPLGESRRGWKWFAVRIGLSVWVRQLFTLAVSRDLYAGVPAIYVNYLDYDVAGHTWGPRHRRALRTLRHLDRSLHQLWRVMRRVPGHAYDLYLLSDHGQVASVPYVRLTGGRRLERLLFEDHFKLPVRLDGPRSAGSRRLAEGFQAYRRHGAPGLFQRFVNYLEQDFPWLLGELPEARQRDGVRVISAGPNAFVYFLEAAAPVTLEWIDRRWPGLVDDIARSRGIGFVLARSEAGPVGVWQGKRYRLDRDEVAPLAGRRDRARVLAGLRDLMAMPSSGDLVIYGEDSPDGAVSYIPELGAHAGPAPEEMETFIVTPPGVRLAEPLTHPVQLYPSFAAYREPPAACA